MQREFSQYAQLAKQMGFIENENSLFLPEKSKLEVNEGKIIEIIVTKKSLNPVDDYLLNKIKRYLSVANRVRQNGNERLYFEILRERLPGIIDRYLRHADVEDNTINVVHEVIDHKPRKITVDL